jgi:hypothetical protein
MFYMGVERAVTRWYIQRQPILEEIARLEALLAQDRENAGPIELESVLLEPIDVQAIAQSLRQAQERLRALGSCPKPMMG